MFFGFLFLILDIALTADLTGFYKFRGIVRIFTVVVVHRKWMDFTWHSGLNRKTHAEYTKLQDRFKTPIENVLDILNVLKRLIDPKQTSQVDDLNYCINVISANKLFDKSEYIIEQEE
jgi:hypothetical protein